jgi:hypothetical protein
VVIFFFIFIYLFICSTGAWTQGLHLEPLHQLFFVKKKYFLRYSFKLFAGAGFELQTSWSLPPE